MNLKKKCETKCLVGGFKHVLFSISYIWDVILPIDECFSEGSSTNQIVEPWVVQALAAPELWHRSIAASDADERGGFGSAPRATRGGSCRVYRG
jgi:hypothetical protein